ncbi:MAG TPA: hypothetical protein VFR32_10035 [Gaiellaceae bacterium]|nr:hypothetical protein [Gaiellaceae bacterium]
MKLTRKRLFVLGAVVAVAAGIAVPAALGVTAIGFLSNTDKQMHDRLFRDGNPSGCHGKLSPGLFGDQIVRRYDKYTFTNTTGASQCVTVFLAHDCGVNAFGQANSPFVPANPAANYLGDAGQSGSPEHFAFPVTAGLTYDIVVGQVDNPLATPCPYLLQVTIHGVQQQPVATAVVGATD